MFRIIGTTVHLTRGNMAPLRFRAKNKKVDPNESDTFYTFKKDDVVRLTIMEVKNYEEVLLQKDVKIETESEYAYITLDANETKIGPMTTKELTYCYEVELNPDTPNTQTIIGHDIDGPKNFIIYPESGNKK